MTLSISYIYHVVVNQVFMTPSASHIGVVVVVVFAAVTVVVVVVVVGDCT